VRLAATAVPLRIAIERFSPKMTEVALKIQAKIS
jgi:hypothetical protein